MLNKVINELAKLGGWGEREGEERVGGGEVKKGPVNGPHLAYVNLTHKSTYFLQHTEKWLQQINNPTFSS